MAQVSMLSCAMAAPPVFSVKSTRCASKIGAISFQLSPVGIAKKGLHSSFPYVKALPSGVTCSLSVPESASPVPLPTFKGPVHRRGIDPHYEQRRTQYATTSHGDEGQMVPCAIVYPTAPNADDDVLAAIKFARENNRAIAVRTGGHQYSGASSTFGENIQLDLSKAYVDFEWDSSTGLLYLGVSHKLRDLNAKLGENHLFVPHGQCSTVNVGGHVQTGGYGQLGRSFGLFGDHVEQIRIITADGRIRLISRDTDDAEEADLFFAVLGGSPGNFGVLTHIVLKPLLDADHKLARGLKIIAPYCAGAERQGLVTVAGHETLVRLLELKAEMAADEGLAADYDFCISLVSDLNSNLPGHSLSQSDIDRVKEAAERARSEHPQLWTNCNPGIIVLYVQWANLGGASQPYDRSFFKKIVRAFSNHRIVHIPTLWPFPKPMSGLTKQWIFSKDREHNTPYNKRTYVTKSTTLARDGWPEYIATSIDNIQKESPNGNGCRLAVQIQHYGGQNSHFRTNDPERKTSYSWRDSSVVCVLDCFYEADREGPKKTADDWQKANDLNLKGPKSNFSKDDRRVLWGSYYATSEEKDMAKAWPFYHESKEKYERLCAIKKAVDPLNVFTPNKFSVQFGAEQS